MDRTVVEIKPMHVSASNPYIISLCDDLLQKWDMAEGEKIWLRYGIERVQVSIRKLTDDDETDIQIPVALCTEHQFPVHPTTISISYDSELQQLRIGPVFALLTETSQAGAKRFGNVTDFARELYTLCTERHLPFFIFSLDDIDGNRVHGYVLNRFGMEKSWFPLPDVIYNRIASRSGEQSDRCQHFFQMCRDFGIAYFNDRFLSKWEVIAQLIELDSVAAYLPETRLYEDRNTVEQLIDKHPVIFIKPIHGREGKGIIRIQHVESGRVQIQLSDRQGRIKPSVSKEAAIKLCEEILRKEEYIVQQGVNLLDYDGGKIDFRILCNRDDSGNWRISSAVSRVSDKTRFVSNLSQGAKTYSSLEMLNRFFDEKTARQLLRTMYELAIAVSTCISQHAGGIFGEFGVDIGIDTDGHPWIIEINTKPSKQFLSDHHKKMVRPSAKGVFQFARYLAGSQPVPCTDSEAIRDNRIKERSDKYESSNEYEPCRGIR